MKTYCITISQDAKMCASVAPLHPMCLDKILKQQVQFKLLEEKNKIITSRYEHYSFPQSN